MAIDLSQFHQLFFDEAAEHLACLERLLLGLDLERPEAEAVDEMFRALHSVKGSAGTFGFQDMAALAHDAETLLGRLRKGEIGFGEAMQTALIETGDLLKAQLAAHAGRGGAGADAERVAAAGHRLLALAEHAAAPSKPAAAAGAPAEAEAEAEAEAQAEAEAPAQEAAYGFFVEPAPGAEVQALPEAPRTAHAAAAEGSIRVGLGRVDRLVNQVGELVITQSMLLQAAGLLDPLVHERLFSGLAQLERNSRELQESVMSMRMVPISTVFGRFPRLVKDLSRKLGKQVALQLHGEATELDRGLVELIADPLTHLVRNSLDHGIEAPAARRAAGKPEQGLLILSAHCRGGNIVIEVRDDGAGLNRQRILAKAREQGLSIAEGAADAEVWQLIFEAGLSTAEAVSDVSGRGVGMDVVRRNVAHLGGRIEVDSLPGVGTHFTLRLPLTLAVADGMLVGVGAETFILPLDHIVESGQPAPGQVRAVRGGLARVYALRGELLPLISLAQVLGLPSGAADFEQGIVVAVEAGGTRQALFVDRLLGQQQFVVKSLEANFRKMPGFSGATILGDGQVAMILDVPALPALAGAALARAA